MQWSLAAIVCGALLMSTAPPAAASDPVEAVVEVDVVDASATSAEPAVDCAGYAPEMATCMGSFVVDGGFGIRYGYQAGYAGYLYIKGETATYTVEIFCDVLIEGNAPSECDVTKMGEMYVGQRFVLTAVAPAFGYWLVQAPV